VLFVAVDTNPLSPLELAGKGSVAGRAEDGSRVVPHEIIATIPDVIRSATVRRDPDRAQWLAP
jgi:hypothetical protein